MSGEVYMDVVYSQKESRSKTIRRLSFFTAKNIRSPDNKKIKIKWVKKGHVKLFIEEETFICNRP